MMKVALYTLEEARKHFEAWKKADLAVAQGQSYQIGTRSLTRANVQEIQKQILYWGRQVEQLENGGRSRSPRMKRVIPIDG